LEYDDHRPGMMRIHVAQEIARGICEGWTRDELRHVARENGVATGYRTKFDLAVALVLAQVIQ
jgi:hypothetical protein